MRAMWFKKVLCVLALLVGFGCHRTPTKLELLRKEVRLVERYMKEDAAGAEAAMLELEAYLRAVEGAGSRDLNLEGDIAAAYSRLYLVNTHMRKDEAAGRYFSMASNYWCRSALGQGKKATAEQTAESINGVDGRVGVPRWRRQE